MSPSLRDVISASPSLFPINLSQDGSVVQLVNLSESDYQAASFLDNRLLQDGMPSAQVPWCEIVNAAAGLPLYCDFIFHISHAGSTLLARLLGLHDAFFSLREPAILRLLGQGRFTDRIDPFLGLFSRTFRNDQKAIIKATSFVSEIGGALLDRVHNSRAVLMYVQAETFLAALLDGALTDITSQCESRLARLQKRGEFKSIRLSSLSPGELVAMSWLSEMRSLDKIAEQFPDRTHWIDFDLFLKEPHDQLSRVFDHFDVHADVNRYLSSETMRRYAKKSEVHYDTDFRRNLLEKSRAVYGEEIRRGLAWLQC